MVLREQQHWKGRLSQDGRASSTYGIYLSPHVVPGQSDPLRKRQTSYINTDLQRSARKPTVREGTKLRPRGSSATGCPSPVTLVTDRTLSWDTEWSHKETIGWMKTQGLRCLRNPQGGLFQCVLVVGHMVKRKRGELRASEGHIEWVWGHGAHEGVC